MGVGANGSRAGCTVRDLDCIYRETDKLYYRFARSCGLSESAYWVLYGVVVGGGSATVRSLVEDMSLRPQTVNSALRSLEERGLVSLDFEPGSRKNKVAILTREGRAFASERVEPALAAEQRAFERLRESDRLELVRLVGEFASAVSEELGSLGGGDAR